MGTWPEFHRCCGFIPLRVGAIIIGAYSVVMNTVAAFLYISTIVLVMRLEEEVKNSSEEVEDANMRKIDLILLFWFVFFAVCEAVIGLLILVGINKAHVLRKAVFYMTIMWLLNLLASLVNASREAYFQAYISAIRMLTSAYFILVIRSTHLQLEGRLDSDSEFPPSRSRSVSGSSLTFHNLAFQPPPPNYDEAMNFDHQNRRGLTLNLVTENEMNNLANSNERHQGVLPMDSEVDSFPSPINERQPMTAVLPVNEQATVNPRRFSVQVSREELREDLKHNLEQVSISPVEECSRDDNLNSRNPERT